MRPNTGSLLVLLLGGCGAMEAAPEMAASAPMQELQMEEMPAEAAAPAAARGLEGVRLSTTGGDGAGLGGMGARGGGMLNKAEAADATLGYLESDSEGKVGAKEAPPGAPETRVREWFPEAFLWQPLVETDASGKATVDVRVPDQLTTWRVLALAHDRQGRQAGAVATFDSRLALYADPVVPAWLYAGDILDLPVQLVNASDAAAAGTLDVTAEGALSGGAIGSVRLAAGGSDVQRVRLVASGAGTGRVRVDLSGEGVGDAVIREIPVIPQGRPVLVEQGGGLSSARTFVLDGPDDSDPATRSVEVRVFAGPLSLIGAELGRLEGAGVPDGAYAFALSARMSALAAASGTTVDPKRVRSLELVAWQKVVRAARSPDAGVAADLLAGVGGSSGNELVDLLKPRLVRAITDGQRGDGTWSRRNEAPLQEVIAQTAWVARSLPADAEGPRRRAAGALERFAPEIRDPYTAALVLSTGLVQGARADVLRKVLTDGLATDPDGTVNLPLAGSVVNPWGVFPARAEVLAVAVLALETGPERDQLVGQLLSRWSGAWGFGAGAADPLVLEAVVAAMPALASKVDVVLTLDGREVSRATVDPTQPYQPAVLTGVPEGSDPSIELHSEPSIPGLAYTATSRSYVPWSGTESLPGVDARVTADGLAVGQESWLVLDLSAPSGTRLVVEQGLAPGVAVDAARLQKPDGSTVDVVGDRIRITTAPFGAGQIQTVRVPVRPSLPGQFSTAPLVLKAGSNAASLRPILWAVAPEGGR